MQRSTEEHSQQPSELKTETKRERRIGEDGYYYECSICGNCGNLLCCDNCPQVFHISCLNPPLKRIPSGTWFCPDCRSSMEKNPELSESKKKSKMDSQSTPKSIVPIVAPASDSPSTLNKSDAIEIVNETQKTVSSSIIENTPSVDATQTSVTPLSQNEKKSIPNQNELKTRSGVSLRKRKSTNVSDSPNVEPSEKHQQSPTESQSEKLETHPSLVGPNSSEVASSKLGTRLTCKTCHAFVSAQAYEIGESACSKCIKKQKTERGRNSGTQHRGRKKEVKKPRRKKRSSHKNYKRKNSFTSESSEESMDEDELEEDEPKEVQEEITIPEKRKRKGKPRKSLDEDEIDLNEMEENDDTETDPDVGENNEIESNDERFCTVCQGEGILIRCDNCTRVYHLDCLDPPLKKAPEGNWICPQCIIGVSNKFKIERIYGCRIKIEAISETKPPSSSALSKPTYKTIGGSRNSDKTKVNGKSEPASFLDDLTIIQSRRSTRTRRSTNKFQNGMKQSGVKEPSNDGPKQEILDDLGCARSRGIEIEELKKIKMPGQNFNSEENNGSKVEEISDEIKSKQNASYMDSEVKLEIEEKEEKRELNDHLLEKNNDDIQMELDGGSISNKHEINQSVIRMEYCNKSMSETAEKNKILLSTNNEMVIDLEKSSQEENHNSSSNAITVNHNDSRSAQNVELPLNDGVKVESSLEAGSSGTKRKRDIEDINLTLEECKMKPEKEGEPPSTNALVEVTENVSSTEPKDEQNQAKEFEFLIKWVGLSHIHNDWVCESQVAALSKRKLDYFKNKHGTNPSNMVDERWKRPQKFIGKRYLPSLSPPLKRLQFFVKWNGLPYDECTWEDASLPIIKSNQDLIQMYEKFERETTSTEKTKSSISPSSKDIEAPIAHSSRKGLRGRKGASLATVDSTDVHPKEFFPLSEQPKELKSKLFPHQLEALNWLRHAYSRRRNVILADEMGLGKTISASAFLSCVKTEFKAKNPCLVLVPLSTLPNWQAEFAGWLPHLNVVEYHGTATSRAIIREYEFHSSDNNGDRDHRRPRSYKFHILLTTYEMIISDSSHLRCIPWEVLVVDEGHRLKNNESKLFNLLNTYSFSHRVLLTGTPLQNNLGEMYNLLHFLEPENFPSLSAFQEKFESTDTAQQVEELKKLVAPHMLRRLKKDTMQNIPPKEERVVPVELTSIQAEYYRALLTRNYELLRHGTSKSGRHQSLLNIVMQLRKVCNHPFLIPGTEPENLSPSELQDMRINASGKLALLDAMLSKLKEGNHRVLIFSQMTKLLDILEDYLTYKFGAGTYERVDGSVHVGDRQLAIARFNQDEKRFVFLLSTRACGLGINLATADTVIIYDSDFNPHADIQAMNRAHRIGQTKRLLVYRLYVKASVEERILQLAKKKLMLDTLLKRKGSASKEVEDILQWGTDELFGKEEAVERVKDETKDTREIEENDENVEKGRVGREGRLERRKKMENEDAMAKERTGEKMEKDEKTEKETSEENEARFRMFETIQSSSQRIQSQNASEADQEKRMDGEEAEKVSLEKDEVQIRDKITALDERKIEAKEAKKNTDDKSKKKTRGGCLGDVYVDKCHNSERQKIIWDQSAIGRLLDRNKGAILDNDVMEVEEEEPSDMLGAVKEFITEEVEAFEEGFESEHGMDDEIKETEKGGDMIDTKSIPGFENPTVGENNLTENKWDALLKARWEQLQLESTSSLGRGKRQRKNVSYSETVKETLENLEILSDEDEDFSKTYSPAGKIFKDKWAKLRSRQMERIANRGKETEIIENDFIQKVKKSKSIVQSSRVSLPSFYKGPSILNPSSSSTSLTSNIPNSPSPFSTMLMNAGSNSSLSTSPFSSSSKLQIPSFTSMATASDLRPVNSTIPQTDVCYPGSLAAIRASHFVNSSSQTTSSMATHKSNVSQTLFSSSPPLPPPTTPPPPFPMVTPSHSQSTQTYFKPQIPFGSIPRSTNQIMGHAHFRSSLSKGQKFSNFRLPSYLSSTSSLSHLLSSTPPTFSSSRFSTSVLSNTAAASNKRQPKKNETGYDTEFQRMDNVNYPHHYFTSVDGPGGLGNISPSSETIIQGLHRPWSLLSAFQNPSSHPFTLSDLITSSTSPSPYLSSYTARAVSSSSVPPHSSFSTHSNNQNPVSTSPSVHSPKAMNDSFSTFNTPSLSQSHPHSFNGSFTYSSSSPPVTPLSSSRKGTPTMESTHLSPFQNTVPSTLQIKANDSISHMTSSRSSYQLLSSTENPNSSPYIFSSSLLSKPHYALSYSSSASSSFPLSSSPLFSPPSITSLVHDSSKTIFSLDNANYYQTNSNLNSKFASHLMSLFPPVSLKQTMSENIMNIINTTRTLNKSNASNTPIPSLHFLSPTSPTFSTATCSNLSLSPLSSSTQISTSHSFSSSAPFLSSSCFPPMNNENIPISSTLSPTLTTLPASTSISNVSPVSTDISLQNHGETEEKNQDLFPDAHKKQTNLNEEIGEKETNSPKSKGGQRELILDSITATKKDVNGRKKLPVWDEDELDFLWKGVRRYGKGKWEAMLNDSLLKFHESRSPMDLAKRWKKEEMKVLGTGVGEDSEEEMESEKVEKMKDTGEYDENNDQKGDDRNMTYKEGKKKSEMFEQVKNEFIVNPENKNSKDCMISSGIQSIQENNIQTRREQMEKSIRTEENWKGNYRGNEINVSNDSFERGKMNTSRENKDKKEEKEKASHLTQGKIEFIDLDVIETHSHQRYSEPKSIGDAREEENNRKKIDVEDKGGNTASVESKFYDENGRNHANGLNSFTMKNEELNDDEKIEANEVYDNKTEKKEFMEINANNAVMKNDSNLCTVSESQTDKKKKDKSMNQNYFVQSLTNASSATLLDPNDANEIETELIQPLASQTAYQNRTMASPSCSSSLPSTHSNQSLSTSFVNLHNTENGLSSFLRHETVNISSSSPFSSLSTPPSLLSSSSSPSVPALSNPTFPSTSSSKSQFIPSLSSYPPRSSTQPSLNLQNYKIPDPTTTLRQNIISNLNHSPHSISSISSSSPSPYSSSILPSKLGSSIFPKHSYRQSPPTFTPAIDIPKSHSSPVSYKSPPSNTPSSHPSPSKPTNPHILAISQATSTLFPHRKPILPPFLHPPPLSLSIIKERSNTPSKTNSHPLTQTSLESLRVESMKKMDPSKNRLPDQFFSGSALSSRPSEPTTQYQSSFGVDNKFKVQGQKNYIQLKEGNVHIIDLETEEKLDE